jgi:hypothetical protein
MHFQRCGFYWEDMADFEILHQRLIEKWDPHDAFEQVLSSRSQAACESAGLASNGN